MHPAGAGFFGTTGESGIGRVNSKKPAIEEDTVPFSDSQAKTQLQQRIRWRRGGGGTMACGRRARGKVMCLFQSSDKAERRAPEWR